MIGYDIEIKGLDEMVDRFERYDEIADRHMKRAMNQATRELELQWKKIAPVGVSGRYRTTIGSKVTGRLGSLVGRVGPSVRIYPAVQEFGRRPGKQPPPGALDRWVQRVLGIGDPKQARSIAFVIGRKMAKGWRRTRPPRRPAATAFRLARGKIRRLFGQALKNLTKELAGK